MRVRVVVLVYLALFTGELSWQAVTPLIPSYIEAYDLTDLQGGLLLSAASLGILVASLPAGYVTRRVHPRALTQLSMGVIAVAGLGLAVAPDYTWVVLCRLVFGLGFGILWVSMAAWLDDAAGDSSARVLAGTTAVVGLGATLGPAYAGAVASWFGLSAPFVGLAVVTLVLLALLLLDRSGTGLRKDPAPPTRELVRAVRSDADLRTMLLLTVAASVVWMTADLLVPLRLDAGGYDAGQIGVIFTVSSVVFVLLSTLTSRGADRWARPGIAAAATVLLALVTLVPTLLTGVPATLVFLIGASVATGVTIALTFPFGLYAVERGAVTVAVMSALANIVWALSGLVGPTFGGVFSQWAGDRWAFAVLTAVCALVAVSVARHHFRGPTTQVSERAPA